MCSGKLCSNGSAVVTGGTLTRTGEEQGDGGEISEVVSEVPKGSAENEPPRGVTVNEVPKGSAESGLSKESAETGMPEDFIELEQERGAFYEFMTVSMNRLYFSYREEGWDAVRRELDRYLRRDNGTAERRRGIDYEARLDAESVKLYRQLRMLRSEIAYTKGVPPYFVFNNRALYEMSVKLPLTMEEFCGIFGVGKKNSGDYGERFLDVIRGFVEQEASADACETGRSIVEQETSAGTGETGLSTTGQEASADTGETDRSTAEQEASADTGETGLSTAGQEASADTGETGRSIVEQETSADTGGMRLRFPGQPVSAAIG